MTRSGYTEDCEDQWGLIRYRGAVKSAIRGARGQSFLKEIVSALDSMPVKRLTQGSLETPSGEFCTLGAVGNMRGVDMSGIDPDDAETVADKFGIANCLAREIVYENDDAMGHHEAPDSRWQRMRNWASSNIK